MPVSFFDERGGAGGGAHTDSASANFGVLSAILSIRQTIEMSRGGVGSGLFCCHTISVEHHTMAFWCLAV